MALPTETKFGQSEKLISEYPLGEMVRIYLDVWKQFLKKSLTTFLFVAICLVVIQIASVFLSVTAVLGLLGSVFILFKDLVFNHPFLSLVSLVVILLGLRTAYARATTR